MVTKSNIYHYFSYVIFALVFFCSIGLYSISISEAQNSADYFIPMAIRYGIVILGIIVLIMGFRLIFKYLPDKYKVIGSINVPKFMEILALVVDCILVLLVRVISVSAMFGSEFSSEYLDYALGQSNVLSNSSMLGYFYGNICKLLVNIHPSAYPIFAFNGLLQIGVIVFTYYAVKQAFRMRYAILSVLVLSFMPMFMDLCLNINPDTLYTFLISIYIFVLVKICTANKNNKIEGNIGFLFIILLGVLGGFITSLDILGVVLLLITIPSLMLIKNPDPWMNIQKNWFQSIIFTLSYLAGTFGFLYLIVNNGLANFENVMNYVYSFVPTGLNVDIIAPMLTRQEGIAIIIFAGVAIFAFLRNEDDKGLYYVLIIDIAAIFTFVNFNNVTYSYLVNYAWALLAVIGFFSLPSFVLSKEELVQAETKKKEKENKKYQKEKEKFLSKNAGSVISLDGSVVSDNPVENNNSATNKDTSSKSNVKEDKLLKKQEKKDAKKQKKANKKNDNVLILEDNKDTMENTVSIDLNPKIKRSCNRYGNLREVC